ncbi:hypothetical protein EDD17DRAFT_1895996 [Pisolithus thermaeus]|nr:hypothetical protein EV401DRAFT_1883097 [Pisolithus croceorrhizus]KAI6162876.1 hypothetical protein EDD17DRAFT_1895996 [Pisolithus thermaeus]
MIRNDDAWGHQTHSRQCSQVAASSFRPLGLVNSLPTSVQCRVGLVGESTGLEEEMTTHGILDTLGPAPKSGNHRRQILPYWCQYIFRYEHFPTSRVQTFKTNTLQRDIRNHLLGVVYEFLSLLSSPEHEHVSNRQVTAVSELVAKTHKDIVPRLSVDVDESVDVRTVSSTVTLPLHTRNRDCKTTAVYEQFMIMVVQVTGESMRSVHGKQEGAPSPHFGYSSCRWLKVRRIVPSANIVVFMVMFAVCNATTGKNDTRRVVAGRCVCQGQHDHAGDKGGSIHMKPWLTNLARKSIPPSNIRVRYPYPATTSETQQVGPDVEAMDRRERRDSGLACYNTTGGVQWNMREEDDRMPENHGPHQAPDSQHLWKGAFLKHLAHAITWSLQCARISNPKRSIIDLADDLFGKYPVQSRTATIFGSTWTISGHIDLAQALITLTTTLNFVRSPC